MGGFCGLWGIWVEASLGSGIAESRIWRQFQSHLPEASLSLASPGSSGLPLFKHRDRMESGFWLQTEESTV